MDGTRDERMLQDATALIETLDAVFGIDVPDETTLAARFARVKAAQG